MLQRSRFALLLERDQSHERALRCSSYWQTVGRMHINQLITAGMRPSLHQNVCRWRDGSSEREKGGEEGLPSASCGRLLSYLCHLVRDVFRLLLQTFGPD